MYFFSTLLSTYIFGKWKSCLLIFLIWAIAYFQAYRCFYLKGSMSEGQIGAKLLCRINFIKSSWNFTVYRQGLQPHKCLTCSSALEDFTIWLQPWQAYELHNLLHPKVLDECWAWRTLANFHITGWADAVNILTGLEAHNKFPTFASRIKVLWLRNHYCSLRWNNRNYTQNGHRGMKVLH